MKKKPLEKGFLICWKKNWDLFVGIQKNWHRMYDLASLDIYNIPLNTMCFFLGKRKMNFEHLIAS